MRTTFQTGMEQLLARHAGCLRCARVGLVAHAASVNRYGFASADLLRAHLGRRLVSLLAPEHGAFGARGAGEELAHGIHPNLGIPVWSLYGATRRPTPEMLAGIDILICDLQDLAVRCYTYASTLRGVLETAAAAGKTVIVTDRPVPLPLVCDGPMLEPARESFVGALPAPLVYGMTPAETARWLVRELRLDLDLRCVPMSGWRRDAIRPAGLPWVPPSPGIRSWESAMCYTATVFTEALPSLDCDRTGLLPFQVLGAPWMEPAAILPLLARLRLPGVRFHAHAYEAGGRAMNGVRMTVTDPARFRPVATGVALLWAVSRCHGPEALWNAPGARPGFFDQLAGTDTLRQALQKGDPPAAIRGEWSAGLRAFGRSRSQHLLYAPPRPRRDA